MGYQLPAGPVSVTSVTGKKSCIRPGPTPAKSTRVSKTNDRRGKLSKFHFRIITQTEIMM